MAVATSFPRRKLYRRAVVFLLWAVLAAFVVDRVSLFVWRHQVLSFYLALHHSETDDSIAAVPLAKIRPPWVAFSATSTGPGLGFDLNFAGQRLRPDRITLVGDQVTLAFEPPALAWSTWFGSPGAAQSKDTHSFTLALNTRGQRPAFRLFAGLEASGTPLSPASPWPSPF